MLNAIEMNCVMGSEQKYIHGNCTKNHHLDCMMQIFSAVQVFPDEIALLIFKWKILECCFRSSFCAPSVPLPIL